MSKITFTKEEKDQIVSKVKDYFDAELNQEIGGFEAEFLIDFFAREVGSFFYNRGLYDAQALLSGKLEEMSDAILELEKPIDLR